MRKLGKAGPLPGFCLSVHYRICFNSESLSVSPSLRGTLKDYESLSLYCNVCEIWKLIQRGTFEKAWRDTGAQLRTSMLSTVSLRGRVAEIQSCNDYHLWILSRCFLQHHEITEHPKSLQKCPGKYWCWRKVSSCIGLESFLKVCSLQYVKVNRKLVNKWINGQMSSPFSSLFWMKTTTVLIFQLRSEIKLSGYLTAHCF